MGDQPETRAVNRAGLRFIVLSVVGTTAAASSLVPESEQISDTGARIEFAGQLALVGGRDREALRIYDEIIASSGGDTAARARRADLLAKLGDLAAAESDLRWVVSRQPSNRTARLALANLLAARGHAVESRRAFEELVRTDRRAELDFAAQMQGWGDFAKAEHIVRSRLAASPDSIPLRLQLAAVLLGAQRFDEAAGVYEEILRRSPRDPEALAGLATTHYLAKDDRAAIDASTRAIERNPTSTEARILRARAAFRGGDTTTALDEFRELTRLPSARAEAWTEIARINLAQGATADAAAASDRALEADPDSLEAAYFSARSRSSDAPVPPRALQSSPAGLHAWAGLLGSDGFHSDAAAWEHAALALDPAYFPPR